jgi:hypothetical protein
VYLLLVVVDVAVVVVVDDVDGAAAAVGTLIVGVGECMQEWVQAFELCIRCRSTWDTFLKLQRGMPPMPTRTPLPLPR